MHPHIPPKDSLEILMEQSAETIAFSRHLIEESHWLIQRCRAVAEANVWPPHTHGDSGSFGLDSALPS
jgi:hypothetical protein